MTPDDYCREKVAQSGSSFYYSFLFLPPERRSAITALYAFCREVDDIVDDVHERILGWLHGGRSGGLRVDRQREPENRTLRPVGLECEESPMLFDHGAA